MTREKREDTLLIPRMRGNITIDSTDDNRIMEYYEQFYADKFDNR